MTPFCNELSRSLPTGAEIRCIPRGLQYKSMPTRSEAEREMRVYAPYWLAAQCLN